MQKGLYNTVLYLGKERDLPIMTMTYVQQLKSFATTASFNLGMFSIASDFFTEVIDDLNAGAQSQFLINLNLASCLQLVLQ